MVYVVIHSTYLPAMVHEQCTGPELDGFAPVPSVSIPPHCYQPKITGNSASR